MKSKALLLAAIIITLALFKSDRPLSGQSGYNIVFVMVDDLDTGMSKALFTGGYLPAIRQYLGDGYIFMNGFVTTSVCCVSRATWLTGQYSHNHGVLGNVPPNGGVTAFDDTNTLATWLDSAGYQTGLIGKYLNQYGSGGGGPLDPLYIPPGWDEWFALVGDVQRMYGYSMNQNGVLRTYGESSPDYQTDVIAQLSQDFIRAAREPFFLAVTPTAPHVESGYDLPGCTGLWEPSIRPAQRHVGALAHLGAPRPPSFNEPNVSDKPPVFATIPRMTSQDVACNDQIYRDKAESMLAVDDLVGAIVAALDETGQTDRTVIIFTSDNGYLFGEHRLPQKLFGYDESIRVPLIIAYPGGDRVLVDDIALNTDWAPTVSDIANVSPGLIVDGRSLLPLIETPGVPWRDLFLVEYLGSVGIAQVPHFRAVRDLGDAAYYAEWADGGVEFYDLALDPYQQRSLHNEPSYAARVADMAAKLRALEGCAGATCMSGEGP